MKLQLSNAIRLALYGAALGLSAQAVADQASGFTIAPGFEYQMLDMDLPLDNPFLGSIGLGYKTSSPLGFELAYLAGSAEPSAGGEDVDLETYRLDALYHFNDDDGVQPYLLVGGGKQSYDFGGAEFKNDMVNLGGGLKVAITDMLSLRSELRLVNDLENELTHYSVGLGLNFLLGGESATSEAVVAAAPSDADKDGVVDAQDRCPGTLAGIRVDANGCDLAIDADGDGVADASDQCPGTSVGAKVDAKGCYIVLTETKAVQLRVNFENNSFVVAQDSYAEVEKVAQFLREYPLTQVNLEGHTDDRGAEAYNQQLSEKRAAAVAQLLVERFDVDQSRVHSTGFGESQPLVGNDTAENRALNRRVTAKISATVQSILK
jgi:OOP family OmpA-OmpF porin